MNGNTLKLAGEFPGTNKEDWLKLVDKVLKGASFDDVLVTETYDNIKINPLYDSLESHVAAPGCYPYTRSTTKTANTQNGWAITQRYAHPNLTENNKQILEDLSRGVTQVKIQFSDLTRLGIDSIESTAGNNGIECYSVSDLEKLFSEVQLELVPIQLDAGISWFEASAALMALWEKNGIAKNTVRAFFNADPAGALAESGHLKTSQENSLQQLANLASYTAEKFPLVKTIGINTTPHHNAGASHSQEIAIALATGVSYLKAMTGAGMEINAACNQIHFTVSCDTDYFQSIAKLRGLRKCWAQVCVACGAKSEHAKISLSAETSQRMLSQRDPWVNVLRGTIASCAAAIGGAQNITTACYDGAIGLPSKLSRRISRNTQLLLQDESSIHKIVDPIGGSYFVENHSDELAAQAWAEFQHIEADGGIFSVLTNGTLQASIDVVRKKRSFNIGCRKDPLTGVSEFANLDETPVETETVDRVAIRKAALEGIEAVSSSDSERHNVESLLLQLQSGSCLPWSNTEADGCTAKALLIHRDAADFEALRDAADKYIHRTGSSPAVYLINIGTPAQYNARAGFVSNFFAAGGITCINEAAADTPELAVSNWQKSQCNCAVLCSTDKLYDEHGNSLVTALREAGIEHIFIAGNALVDITDTQLSLTSNTLDILNNTHQLLKVS